MDKLTEEQKTQVSQALSEARTKKGGDLSKKEKEQILDDYIKAMTKTTPADKKEETGNEGGAGQGTMPWAGSPTSTVIEQITEMKDESSSLMVVKGADTLRAALVTMYKAGLKGLTLREGGTMNSTKHRRAIKGMIQGLKVSEISKEVSILLLCACNNKDRVVGWLKTENFQGINTAEILIVLAAIPRKEKKRTGTTFDVQVPSAFPHYVAFTTVLMMADMMDQMRKDKFYAQLTQAEKEMIVREFLNNRHVGQLDLTEDMQAINEIMTTAIWKDINEHKKGEEGFDSKKSLYKVTIAKDKYPLIDINSGNIIPGPYNMEKIADWVWETAAFLSRP